METTQDEKIIHNNEEGPAYRPPKVQNFRTLQSDMIGAVQKQDKSIAQVVLSAKKRKWAEKKREEGNLERVYVENKYERSRYRLFLIGIIVIIGVLVGIKTFVYPEHPTSQQEKVFSLASFPITEKVALNVLNLESATLAEKIPLVEKSAALYDGDIVIFTIIEPVAANSPVNVISTKYFTELWAYNMPDELLSRVGRGSFLVGRYVKETTHTFVVYELANNEETTALLKKWEENMAKDTERLFAEQKNSSENMFVNATISDVQQVRLLENTANDPAVPVVVYGFVDNSLLIVSDSTDIFTKLLEKNL